MLGGSPVLRFPIPLNPDKLRGGESPETLSMFTEGGSEGGKDRMQFRSFCRQNSKAEFADAIFQSAVHGAQWARVRLDSHVPKWLFDASAFIHSSMLWSRRIVLG